MTLIIDEIKGGFEKERDLRMNNWHTESFESAGFQILECDNPIYKIY